MATKPTGLQVVKQAISILETGATYAEMDCQKFVETCVSRAGGSMDYAGSNDMARNACMWLGTIENAKAEGKLVPGAGLLIHEDDESDLPAKYRGDGLGDFNHVGLYIGDNLAVKDYAKGALFKRKCNVIHSSSSMGRVAGSTLQNGWTHVIWFKEIDYGVTVTPGVTLGVNVEATVNTAYDEAGFETENAPAEGTYTIIPAVIYAENGKPVKLRSSPSTKSKLYWTRDVGTAVEVLERGDTWCKVRSRSRVGYVMTKFLQFSEGEG